MSGGDRIFSADGGAHFHLRPLDTIANLTQTWTDNPDGSSTVVGSVSGTDYYHLTINADGTFSASTAGGGLGVYAAGTLTNVTTGGATGSSAISDLQINRGDKLIGELQNLIWIFFFLNTFCNFLPRLRVLDLEVQHGQPPLRTQAMRIVDLIVISVATSEKRHHAP